MRFVGRRVGDDAERRVERSHLAHRVLDHDRLSAGLGDDEMHRRREAQRRLDHGYDLNVLTASRTSSTVEKLVSRYSPRSVADIDSAACAGS